MCTNVYNRFKPLLLEKFFRILITFWKNPKNRVLWKCSRCLQKPKFWPKNCHFFVIFFVFFRIYFLRFQRYANKSCLKNDHFLTLFLAKNRPKRNHGFSSLSTILVIFCLWRHSKITIFSVFWTSQKALLWAQCFVKPKKPHFCGFLAIFDSFLTLFWHFWLIWLKIIVKTMNLCIAQTWTSETMK